MVIESTAVFFSFLDMSQCISAGAFSDKIVYWLIFFLIWKIICLPKFRVGKHGFDVYNNVVDDYGHQLCMASESHICPSVHAILRIY